MFLLLDYSSPSPQALLRHEGKTIASLIGTESKIRQALQAEKIGYLLQDSGVTPEALDFAVCGLGPGSFSGIRSALCALIGLTLPHKKPLLGFSSAIGCAVAAYRAEQQIPDPKAAAGRKVSVVGDARRNRLWVVNYTVFPDFTVRLENGGAPSHAPADFALVEREKLFESVPGDALVVSPDFVRLEAELTEAFAGRLLMKRAEPEIEALALAIEADVQCAAANPAPIYLQPAVAALPR